MFDVGFAASSTPQVCLASGSSLYEVEFGPGDICTHDHQKVTHGRTQVQS